MKINFKNSLGITLIIAGVLFLIQSLKILEGKTGDIIWLVLYGIATIYTLFMLFRQKSQFLWMILSVVFLIVTANTLSNLLEFPAWADGSITFAILGIALILFYLSNRTNWWALIPAGIIISIGIISGLENSGISAETNGIVFFGLGTIFLFLFILPSKYERMKWSLIPGIALVGIGYLFTYGADGTYLGFIGPVLLVVTGIIFLFHTSKKSR